MGLGRVHGGGERGVQALMGQRGGRLEGDDHLEVGPAPFREGKRSEDVSGLDGPPLRQPNDTCKAFADEQSLLTFWKSNLNSTIADYWLI